MIGIYLIQNIVNNKCYIGQSINIPRRWRRHINDAFNPNSNSYEYLLQRAIRKYGVENFTFQVILECEPSQLDKNEISFIKQYNSLTPNGYNCSIGGQGGPSFVKLNEQTLQELREDLRKGVLTIKEIENKFNISHQMIYDINNGKSWFDTTITYPIRVLKTQDQKQTKKQKLNFCQDCGEPIYQGSIRCVSCYHKSLRTIERPEPLDLIDMVAELGFAETGRRFNVSDNAIRKWCVAYNLPNKKDSIIQYYNTIHNIIEPKKRKVTVTSQNKKIGKKVLQIDKNTGEILNIFNSCSEAARFLGNNDYNKHISSVASGSRVSAYGYKWRYE